MSDWKITFLKAHNTNKPITYGYSVWEEHVKEIELNERVRQARNDGCVLVKKLKSLV